MQYITDSDVFVLPNSRRMFNSGKSEVQIISCFRIEIGNTRFEFGLLLSLFVKHVLAQKKREIPLNTKCSAERFCLFIHFSVAVRAAEIHDLS